MAVNTPELPLRVLECSGTARSGKGSKVSKLAERHLGVATEETGADYRVVTFSLLHEDVLEPDMPKTRVLTALGRQSVGRLAELVAARPEVVAANGLESLYTEEVNGVVAYVSQVPHVRSAVKEGFKRRVQAVVDNPDYDILLVDGRNLAPVIREIPGTELILRTFVSCTSEEAARREAIRNGQADDADAINKYFLSFDKRNREDAERAIDPVRPDDDALDFWQEFGASIMRLTAQDFLKRSGNFLDFLRSNNWNNYDIPEGLGTYAVITGRQIHFDTTRFNDFGGCSMAAMIDAADIIFEEAIAASDLEHLRVRALSLAH